LRDPDARVGHLGGRAGGQGEGDKGDGRRHPDRDRGAEVDDGVVAVEAEGGVGHEAPGSERLRARGSRASGRPSPMKLTESTAAMGLALAGTHVQGIDASTLSDWAAVRMPPQLGWGVLHAAIRSFPEA
jgi:hypothetical protein